MTDFDGTTGAKADESVGVAPSPATESATLPTTDTNPPAAAAAEAAPQPPASNPASRETSPAASGLPQATRTAPKKVVAKKPSATRPKVPAKKAAVKKAAPRKTGKATVVEAKAATPKKAPAKKRAAVEKPVAKQPVTRKTGKAKAVSSKAPVAKKASAEHAVVTKPAGKGATKKKGKPIKVTQAPAVPAKTVLDSKAQASVTSSQDDRASDTAKKMKLVRDSFTMPHQDYALIAALKERALEYKRPAKKSELLRAGLHALAKLTHGELGGALDALAPLKAGRPKKRAG